MRRGFTLAEVLVTLGIIGVVSAMTVPTLMQNYQRKSYVTQLHKVYNEFSQALLQYQTDKNAVNLTEAGLVSQDAANSFVKSYFKTVQECDSMDDCFEDKYMTLSGENFSTYSRSVHSFVLANGASVRVSYVKEFENSVNKLFNVGVDVKGKKGPNILGRDLFFFAVYNNGLIDDFIDNNSVPPLSKDDRESKFQSQCNSGAKSSGWGCFGKILNDNWEMTY